MSKYKDWQNCCQQRVFIIVLNKLKNFQYLWALYDFMKELIVEKWQGMEGDDK